MKKFILLALLTISLQPISAYAGNVESKIGKLPALLLVQGEFKPNITESKTFNLHEKTELILIGMFMNDVADYSAISPSGKTYNKTSPEYSSDQADVFGYIKTFEIKDAEPGTWTITVKTSDKPTQYSISALAETSYTLQIDTGEHSEFKSNEPFSINAKYMKAGQPVIGAKVIARLPKVPYAKPIELFDDGAHNDGNANDGLYSNLYPGFKEAVFAQIFVKAEYKDITTESFNRTVTVRPDYAALGNNFSDSAVNIDSHPSLDVIRVNAEVIISKDAEILVTSALCDHRGTILATSGWDTKVDEPLKPGTHKISFNFDTARLYNTGLPGPYKLCNVTITEINSGMPIQHISGAVYDTKVYDINLFNR